MENTIGIPYVKEVILRYDAKDIIVEVIYNKFTKKDETYIRYKSDSHPSNMLTHVVMGNWKLDYINNNVVILINN